MVTTKLGKAEKLKHCIGCRSNFYNGNNPMGIKECWHLKDAKLVLKKRVSINQVPPYKQSPIKVLNCYEENGYVYIDPKAQY